MTQEERNKLYGFKDRYAHEHVLEDQVKRKSKLKPLLLNKDSAQDNQRVISVTKAQYEAYELIRSYGKPVSVDTLRKVGIGLSTIKALKSKLLLKGDDIVELTKREESTDKRIGKLLIKIGV